MLVIEGLSFLKNVAGMFSVDRVTATWEQKTSCVREGSLALGVHRASRQVTCNLSCTACSCILQQGPGQDNLVNRVAPLGSFLIVDSPLADLKPS